MSGQRELRATIYGARGSLPNPSVSTQKYGGATTCLGVNTPDHIPIAIDGGSGIFDYGLRILREAHSQHEVHLFFTHTHWDHVQGLPFFVPFYDARWAVHIYSLGERRGSLRDIFTGVYGNRYFPVPFERLNATIFFHGLDFESEVNVGNTTIRSCRVNHPGYALGFRVEHGDRSFFFASDTAPFRDMLFGDRFHTQKRETEPEKIKRMSELEGRMDAAAKGVDLVFHDSNYTESEYEDLYHFGHSSMSQSLEMVQRCGARHLVLWHHDRKRADEEIEKITAPIIERGRREGVVIEPARQGACYSFPLQNDVVVSV